MTRRTLFASLIGAPVAAASVHAIADAPKAAQISTYWEGERLPVKTIIMSSPTEVSAERMMREIERHLRASARGLR